MCLTKPAQIKSIKGNIAVVESGGKKREVNIALLPKAKVGDWILAQANLAIEKISSREAKEIKKLIK